MVPNLEESIAESKALLDNTFNPCFFGSYCKSYLFTTENIRGYLKTLKETPESALTVLASGDQIFNLAAMGTKRIDAFDINKLTYYFFWLKYSVIMTFSREQFIDTAFAGFHLRTPMFLKELLNACRSNMPEDVYTFFNELIRYQNGKKANGFEKLLFGEQIYRRDKNIYASDEQMYKKLQKGLEQLELKFYFGDAREVPSMVDGSYDLILLSNISDYLGDNLKPLHKDEFDEYIARFYKLLNAGGTIINYLYYFYFLEDNELKCLAFDHSDVFLKDIGFENIKNLGDEQGFYRIRKPKNKK